MVLRGCSSGKSYYSAQTRYFCSMLGWKSRCTFFPDTDNHKEMVFEAFNEERIYLWMRVTVMDIFQISFPKWHFYSDFR